MSESRSFETQQLGFYFAINEMAWSADESSAVVTAREAADAIQVAAYQLLEKQLPKGPLWMLQDEHEPESSYSPYVLCELELLTEDIEGMEAYSLWLYSYHPISADTAWAFQQAVAAAYAQAAEGLGGNCRFLKLVSSVTEEVTTTTDLARLPQAPEAEGLTEAQRAHMAQIAADGLLSAADRECLADFLRRGVSVIVFHQHELRDAPPFVVAPVEAQDVWLGTWHTAEEATAQAVALGLQVQETVDASTHKAWLPFNAACIPHQQSCRWFVQRDGGVVDHSRGFRSKADASAWIDSFGERLDWRAGFLFRLKGETVCMTIVSRTGQPAKA